jgi:hypothetical protein
VKIRRRKSDLAEMWTLDGEGARSTEDKSEPPHFRYIFAAPFLPKRVDCHFDCASHPEGLRVQLESRVQVTGGRSPRSPTTMAPVTFLHVDKKADDIGRDGGGFTYSFSLFHCRRLLSAAGKSCRGSIAR